MRVFEKFTVCSWACGVSVINKGSQTDFEDFNVYRLFFIAFFFLVRVISVPKMSSLLAFQNSLSERNAVLVHNKWHCGLF